MGQDIVTAAEDVNETLSVLALWMGYDAYPLLN